MFFSLVLRNVARNLLRLLPMVMVLILSFSALIAGNAVLGSSDDALYRTYAAHVAGDFSVAARGDGTFTIFGSDALLVGEYLVPPTIAEFDRVREVVEQRREVRTTAAIVSAVARIEAQGRREDNVLFGVDFRRYGELFPALELVAGRWPAAGERGLVVQEGWGGHAAEALPGQRALLAVAHDVTFTLREVPIAGVFRYPIEDEMLRRVALVDPDTARALNGYIYGAGGVVEVQEDQRDLLESDLDDLFGSAAGDFEGGDGADVGSDAEDDDILASLQSFFAETRQETESARATVDGAWNFLLVSLYDRDTAGAVTAALARGGWGASGGEGVLIRDWRGTVGGTAQIVWYLQLMFNAGLLFVAFGAAVITTNALVLSVLERTAEIGTMRALGATRARVAAMIAAETLVVVAGSALVGILLGTLATGALDRAAIVPENPYLAILFGGGAIGGVVTGGIVLTHLGAALALTVLAVLYPLKRALGIAPVQAMSAA